MEKIHGGLVTGQAKDFYGTNKVAAVEFKPCEKKTPLHLFMSGQGEQQDQDPSLTGCPYRISCTSDSSVCGRYESDGCPYPNERRKWGAIETRYKGYRFRSRLEARWAVYFDALSMKWDYEKEGFDLGSAGYYLPDFWLPEASTWAEVKPTEFTSSELEKIKRLGDLTGQKVLMLVEVPDLKPYWCYDPSVSYTYDVAVCWYNETGRLYGSIGEDFSSLDFDERVLPGVRAARSARFEHGEDGL